VPFPSLCAADALRILAICGSSPLSFSRTRVFGAVSRPSSPYVHQGQGGGHWAEHQRGSEHVSAVPLRHGKLRCVSYGVWDWVLVRCVCGSLV
jgi:hypothetical protein